MERCCKCKSNNNHGKNYSFYFGEITSSSSYETKRYAGSKLITTTHSSTRYQMHGKEDCFLCNSCVIKNEIRSNIISFSVIAIIIALIGYGLQFVFYSRTVFTVALVIAGLFLIYSTVSAIKETRIANSNDAEKQAQYISKNNLRDNATRLAINTLKKTHISKVL